MALSKEQLNAKAAKICSGMVRQQGKKLFIDVNEDGSYVDYSKAFTKEVSPVCNVSFREFTLDNVIDREQTLIALGNRFGISVQMVLVDVADMWAATKWVEHNQHKEIMVCWTHREALEAGIEAANG